MIHQGSVTKPKRGRVVIPAAIAFLVAVGLGLTPPYGEKAETPASAEKAIKWDREFSIVVPQGKWKRYTLPRSRREYIIQFECLTKGKIKTPKTGRIYSCSSATKDSWMGGNDPYLYFRSAEKRFMTVIIRIKYD